MIKLSSIKHILIAQTANIGDLMISRVLPNVLKAHNPNLKITYLVPDYSAGLLSVFPEVDHVISADTLSALPKEEAVSTLKTYNIECAIILFLNKQLTTLIKQAKIKYRIGATGRLYHLLHCNYRIYFTKKDKLLHESQMKLKFLKPFGILNDYSLPELTKCIAIHDTKPLPDHLKRLLDSNKFNLIIHPFTNGHTREWPISSFNELITNLPQDKFNIILTGSPKEEAKIAKQIIAENPHIQSAAGKSSLTDLITLIQHSDGIIANSTGPMHLGATLNKPTLGLFPPQSGPIHYSMSRWRPLGKYAETLSADSNCQAPACREHDDCFCMSSITPQNVLSVIKKWQEASI